MPEEIKTTEKGLITSSFDKLKTPVFWLAIGYGLAMFINRGSKNKAVG